MKTIKKVLAISLAMTFVLGSVKVIYQDLVKGKAENPVEAVPTSQALDVLFYGGGGDPLAGNKISIYSIIQDNGWGANYVKLRDIAYYIDFDVVWNAATPNEMRIYTDRHYLDMWTETGPALETKAATKSTMDVYVDDVKVEVDAYMIDNNNYFKIRDLAKAVGFGCIYNARAGGVGINANYPYQDGDKLFTDKNYPTKRVINYQSTIWYDSSSGTLMASPDVNKALSPRNPTARMNYWAELVGDDVKSEFGNPDLNGEWVELFNVRVQTLADKSIISSGNTYPYTERDSSGYPSNRTLYINPQYVYPTTRVSVAGYREDSSLGYQIVNLNIAGNNSVGATLNVPVDTLNPDTLRRDDASENIHECWIGIKQDTAHILAEMNEYSSDREKIQYLGKQVCARMDYAQKGNTLPGGMAALNDGSFWAGWPTNDVASGVCEHYVRAFERICVAAGYDYVRLKNATHSWDIVFIPDEAKWVVVDCTFADGDGIYGTNTGAYDKYLCCELEDYDHSVQCLNIVGTALYEKTCIEVINQIKKAGL